VQKLIKAREFIDKHKKSDRAFTRNRKLNFSLMIVLMLQKSLKSIQVVLNEMVMKLNKEDTVSNSAYTQARANLNYTAFIELNEESVVKIAYEDDNEIKNYKGMRVLGIDGSKIVLPNTKDVIEDFGQISYGNSKIKGKQAYGLASVMYDVLNNIAIDSELGKAKAYEVDLAIEHLSHTKENDLIICDRNYPSYRFLANLTKMKRNFVIRCSASSFKQAREMLKGVGGNSRIVTIRPQEARLKKLEKELPKEIKVRFVRVELSTGEYEVLVTNLLDEEKFSTEEFLDIYALRWGIETFYDIIKNRLNLENFTGKTALSIKQDFYSTIFISGLETILTSDINLELEQKETKNKQKVNHVISFNAIKNKALDLIFAQKPVDDLLKQLEILFLTNRVQVRKNRNCERTKTTDRNALNHIKRKQKICY
jgi:hypothetical protein